MRTQDVVKHFGSQAAVARSIGITAAAVSQWGELVPFESAYRLFLASRGELFFDPRVYDRKRTRTEAS